MSHVDDVVPRLDPLHPRKPIRLWQYPLSPDGKDRSWADVR
jgi:hypothetical protein